MNGIGRYNFRMYLYRCAGRDFAGIHSRLQEQNTISHDSHCALKHTVQSGVGEFLVMTWLSKGM